MSLHIKLFNNFWNHKKTARLRAIIGDDAFWIPPRLWSYASENQPDGDFKDYSSEEISMLVALDKHTECIKEALISSGYMNEDGKLHDWQEHNGFHFTFAERAKKAAKARWDKEKKKEASLPDALLSSEVNRLGTPSSISGSDPMDMSAVLAHWNAQARRHGLKELDAITHRMERGYFDRCKECGSQGAFWTSVERELPLLGDKARSGGWFNFLWLLQNQDNFMKFKIGSYRKEGVKEKKPKSESKEFDRALNEILLGYEHADDKDRFWETTWDKYKDISKIKGVHVVSYAKSKCRTIEQPASTVKK